MKTTKRVQDKVPEVKLLLGEAKSLRRVSQITGLSSNTVKRIKQGEIKQEVEPKPITNKLSKAEKYNFFKKLALEGRTFEYMSLMMGVRRQAVHQYFNYHPELKRIKNISKRALEREEDFRRQNIRKIIQQSTSIVYTLASEEEQNAFDHLEQANVTRVKKAYSVLLDYFIQEKNGGKTNKYFSEKHGLDMMSVGRLFQRAGLKPQISPRSRTRRIPSKSEEMMIARATETSFNDNDLEFLLEFSYTVFMKRRKKERPQKNKILSSTKTSYFKAMEIYEAEDLGFSIEEIGELVDKSTRTVSRILDNQNLRKEITSNLSYIFDKDFNKPYFPR